MAFARKKYQYLLIIISLLILGFLMMSGGSSNNPNDFSSELFSFRRITLAPLMVIGSYIALIWLILSKTKH